MIEVQAVPRERSLEQRHEVGPVSDVASGTVEALAVLAHRLDEQDLAIPPAPELPGRFESNGACRQLFGESERTQEPDHVGCNHDPGTDLDELGSLLVHADVEARLVEKQRGREPADAAAHDGDPQAHRAPHARARAAGLEVHIERIVAELVIARLRIAIWYAR